MARYLGRRIEDRSVVKQLSIRTLRLDSSTGLRKQKKKGMHALIIAKKKKKKKKTRAL